MNTILKVLWEIALTSSLLILVVLALRRLFKNKISAAIRYSLWGLVAFRLLMPFGIPSPAGMMNLFSFSNPREMPVQTKIVPIGKQNETAEPIMTIVRDETGSIQASLQPDGKAITGFTPVVTAAWVTGVLCTAVYMIFINVHYIKTITKNATEFSDEENIAAKTRAGLKIRKQIPVLLNNEISSPSLVGWLHPKIMINSQTLENENSLRHVLLHELCHYKQGDNWIALLRNVCCVVYWFNPMIWLAAVVSKEDAELACDEKVLRHLKDNENISYGETLLRLVKKNDNGASVMQASTMMSTGGKKMNERINQMISRPKTVKSALLCVLVILLAASGIAFSSAMPINADAAPYAALKKISAYKTPTAADVSKVGRIIENLPEPSAFGKQNNFSLQTQSQPYGLTIYYESNDYDGPQVPFWDSKRENNALILFAFIDDLSQISFAFRDTPSNGIFDKNEYNSPYIYSRTDIIQRFGDLEALRNNSTIFNKTLSDNLKIDPYRVHNNRITFESTYEHVIYRDSDPDEIIRNADQSYQMIYKNLGEGRHYDPETQITEIFPGEDIIFYLDGYGIEGVYAACIKGDSSELSYRLGLEGVLTYASILQRLGRPQVSQNNNTVISYLLYGYDNRYVTFRFDDNGNVESHGFHTGDFNPFVNL